MKLVLDLKRICRGDLYLLDNGIDDESGIDNEKKLELKGLAELLEEDRKIKTYYNWVINFDYLKLNLFLYYSLSFCFLKLWL